MAATAQQVVPFVLAQFAAESYLEGVIGGAPELLPRRLRLGSNNFTYAGDSEAASRDVTLSGYTRMTDAQIAQFIARYDIIDHLPNTITGFSATLLWDKLDSRYVLSFRSTEYPNEDQGGDWRRDGLNGADGEIGAYGFAYAQIADMEAYYQQIVKPLIANSNLGSTNFPLLGSDHAKPLLSRHYHPRKRCFPALERHFWARNWPCKRNRAPDSQRPGPHLP